MTKKEKSTKPATANQLKARAVFTKAIREAFKDYKTVRPRKGFNKLKHNTNSQKPIAVMKNEKSSISQKPLSTMKNEKSSINKLSNQIEGSSNNLTDLRNLNQKQKKAKETMKTIKRKIMAFGVATSNDYADYVEAFCIRYYPNSKGNKKVKLLQEFKNAIKAERKFSAGLKVLKKYKKK